MYLVIASNILNMVLDPLMIAVTDVTVQETDEALDRDQGCLQVVGYGIGVTWRSPRWWTKPSSASPT